MSVPISSIRDLLPCSLEELDITVETYFEESSSCTALSTDLAVWKPPPDNTWQLLTFNVDRSDSPPLTTIGLRSRQISATCSGESFRRILSIKHFVNGLKGIRMRARGLGSEEAHRWVYILQRASVEEADLMDIFSKSKHLDELHKHQTRKGQYLDFHSKEFWTKFHKARQKAEEEAAATGTSMPDDL
ncbi:hypothetical protein M9H77_16197 [Catharanthus roseus]|uniref:Uncharacterized protein n=1 Tax=Catharanthus roseus TaxID=4058 RepID=A0ACC0B0U9_CATRO|nr:hypothetical protein M9H77_16197 [Catharanthus roseus]